MVRVAGLQARVAVLALVVFAIFAFVLVGPYKVTPGHISHRATGQNVGQASQALLKGHAIAPKLANATAK